MKKRKYPNSPAHHGVQTGSRNDRQSHCPATLILACLLSTCVPAASADNTPTSPPPLDVFGTNMASEQAGRSFTSKNLARNEAQARLPAAVTADDAMAVRNELALGATITPAPVNTTGIVPGIYRERLAPDSLKYAKEKKLTTVFELRNLTGNDSAVRILDDGRIELQKATCQNRFR